MTGDETPADVEVPEELDFDNLDQYSDAQIEAYNQRKKQEIHAEMERLNEAEADAIDALREHAQESQETEPVDLGQVELEVLTRIPPEVEELEQEAKRARKSDDVDLARRLMASVAAEMTASPDEYQSIDVWVVAAKEFGMHWLAEALNQIQAPAKDRAEGLDEGNSKDSDASLHRTTGRQSGWQQQG